MEGRAREEKKRKGRNIKAKAEGARVKVKKKEIKGAKIVREKKTNIGKKRKAPKRKAGIYQQKSSSRQD